MPNILSYLQQKELEQQIEKDLANCKQNPAQKAHSWTQACGYYSSQCGFKVTESNLRYMLEQLKIDPRNLIVIKQPRQLQNRKKKDSVDYRLDRMEKEIITLRTQVVALSTKALEK